MQRWEREGRLIPIGRTDSNRRLYTASQIKNFLGIRQSAQYESSRLIAYCRVSSTAQKPDLINQRRILEEFIVARELATVKKS